MIQTALTPEELEVAQIPRRFWNLSKEDYYGSPKALKVVEQYVSNKQKVWKKGTCLIFNGEENSGKTFLITYALRCLMAYKYPVRYTTMADLTEAMMRPDLIRNFRSEISYQGFLALDNITEVNAGTQSAFRRFVAHRRDAALPMLVSTNAASSKEMDFFLKSYEPDSHRLQEIAVMVDCSVNPFKTESMYAKIRKAAQ